MFNQNLNQFNQSKAEDLEKLPVDSANQKNRADNLVSVMPEKFQPSTGKPKNIKKIVLILVLIFGVAGLAFAGYLYKDKIFGKNTEVEENLNNNSQDLNQENNTNNENTEMPTDDSIISVSDYSQFVLTEDDVKSEFSSLKFLYSANNITSENKEKLLYSYTNTFANRDANNLLSDGGPDLILLSNINYCFVSSDEAKKMFDDDKKSTEVEVNDKAENISGVGESAYILRIDNDWLALFIIKNCIGVIRLVNVEFEQNNKDKAINLIRLQAKKYENYNNQSPIIDINLDSDSDGLIDTDEAKYGTDPNNSDSDSDGYKDGEEIKNGYDPLGAGKIYINDKYNFSFSYSKEWSAPIFEEGDFYGGGSYPGNENSKWKLNIGGIAKGFCEGTDCYRLYFDGGFPTKDYNLIVDDLNNSDNLTKILKQINIVNGSAIIYTEGGMCESKDAMIFGNNQMIKFSGYCVSSGSSLEKSFDQILSTFKFLD
jgi:hypothetical protein